MYYSPMFFQTVLLDSPEQASARLTLPSLSFTIVSALSAYMIARLGSPAPTLQASQPFLVLGTGGLVLMAGTAWSYQLDKVVYTLLLGPPVIGASMLAPSVLMVLLHQTAPEDHASVNSNFILARSLGFFGATAIGSTLLHTTIKHLVTKLDLSPDELNVRPEAVSAAAHKTDS